MRTPGIAICLTLLAGVAPAQEDVPLDFDGFASLSFPHDPAFAMGASGTVDALIRADWAGELEQDACIAANALDADVRWGVYVLADGSGLVLFNGAESGGVSFDFLDGAAHHVAVSTDAGRTTFYVDGTLLGTKDIGFGPSQGLPLHIGTSDGISEGFQGQIASVRTWNRALNDGEVVEISAAEGQPEDGRLSPALLAYTHFRDGSPTMEIVDQRAPTPPPSRPDPQVTARFDDSVAEEHHAAPAANPFGGGHAETLLPPAPPGDPGVQLWQLSNPTDGWRQQATDPELFAYRNHGAVEFWVRFEAAASRQDPWATVVAYSDGFDTVFEVGITADGRGVVFGNAKRDSYGQVARLENIVPFDFGDGRIHHVAAITRDDTTEVFVDGQSRGKASVGFGSAEDWRGPKRNLQLAIGSLDYRTNGLIGSVGGIRVWGVALPAEALFHSAFLRDDELLRLPWAQSYLVAHLDNVAGRASKPSLRFRPGLYIPGGTWMDPTDEKLGLEDPGAKVPDINWTFLPQSYVHLSLAAADSELAQFAESGNVASARNPAPGARRPSGPSQQVAGDVPGFRLVRDAGVMFRPARTYQGISAGDCADRCAREAGFICVSFDYAVMARRCELNERNDAPRDGLRGIAHYVRLSGSEAPAAAASAPALAFSPPTGSPATVSAPVLVWTEFTPFMGLNEPERIRTKVFRPTRMNEYASTSGETLVLSSRDRLQAGSVTLQRFDRPQTPPRPDETASDNPFIVGNQLRNRDALLNGWDLISLNPFNFEQPEGGRKAQIFDFPKYGYKEKARQIVPKGFDLIDVQSGGGRIEHQEIKTEEQMQNALSLNIGGGGGVEGFGSFSANASFAMKTRIMKSGQKAYTIAQTVHNRFAVHVDKPNLTISPRFRQVIEQAASRTPSQSAAYQIVREFGTHYAHAVVFGARTVETVELTSEMWGKIESYDVGVAAAVEAGAYGVTGNVEFGADVGFEEQFQNTISSSKTNWSYTGGASGGGGLVTHSVADDTAGPVFLDLRPIHELLAPPFFDDPQVFATLRPMVRDAIWEYAKRTGHDVSSQEFFRPKQFARYVPETPKKGCEARSWKDSHKDAWVLIELPAGTHGASHFFQAGCTRDWVAAFDCDGICWDNTTMRCEDGTWKVTGWDTSGDELCHDSGQGAQAPATGGTLKSGTSGRPW